jgi:excisionase family DNA binding protein
VKEILEVEHMFSTEKCAELMEVTPHTVRQWIRDGKINAVKLGGRYWRVPRSSILEFANTKYGQEYLEIGKKKGDQDAGMD